jgi:hypothetical protein
LLSTADRARAILRENIYTFIDTRVNTYINEFRPAKEFYEEVLRVPETGYRAVRDQVITLWNAIFPREPSPELEEAEEREEGPMDAPDPPMEVDSDEGENQHEVMLPFQRGV